MLPIVLDLARFDTVVIGDRDAAARRRTWLEEAGGKPRVYSSSALPGEPELAGARLVFIADRHAPYAADLAAQARANGALVHIEDDPARSDFHMPAVLRRGELMLAVSTGGASPALAVRLKRALAELFGPEWRGRTEEIALLRRAWRADGADAETLKRRTEDWLDRQEWLPELSPHPH
jgi:precorrin-2 dehydrogenase/sirohydrochlorin ferrochelatase